MSRSLLLGSKNGLITGIAAVRFGPNARALWNATFSTIGMSALCEKQTWTLGKAARAFAEALIRSVEPIVQPAAKDAIGEMAMRSDLPPGHPLGTRT